MRTPTYQPPVKKVNLTAEDLELLKGLLWEAKDNPHRKDQEEDIWELWSLLRRHKDSLTGEGA